MKRRKLPYPTLITARQFQSIVSEKDAASNKEALTWLKSGFYYEYLKNIRKAKGSENLAQYAQKNNRIAWNEKIVNDFGLRGVEYGRWLNNNDRFVYTLSAYSGLHDLATVLNWKHKSIGANFLLLCLGSRGRGRSLAHYHPSKVYINLNRYPRPDKVKGNPPKSDLFEDAGGVQSLAHEFAHFLDCFCASDPSPLAYPNIPKGYFSLTGNPRKMERSMLENLDPQQYNSAAGAVQYAIYPFVYKENGEFQPVVGEIIDKYPKRANYYLNPLEIWARSFEVYIYNELKAKGIENFGLTHSGSNYNHLIYPKFTTEFRKRMKVAIGAITKLMNK